MILTTSAVDDREIARLKNLVQAPVEELTPFERLDRISYLEVTSAEEVLLNFVEQYTLFYGRKGTGKTMMAVSIIKQLKDVFGIETVCDFQLSSNFGVYTYIDIERFLDQLRMVNELTKGQSEAIAKRAVDGMMEQGVNGQGSLMTELDGKAVCFDEAYKYLDSRDSTTRLVKLFSHFISQMRHFRVSMFMIAPHPDMLDKRARRQIDNIGECYTDPEHFWDGNKRVYVPPSNRSTLAVVHNLSVDEKFEVEVNVAQGGELYDTHVKTAFRSQLLNDAKED